MAVEDWTEGSVLLDKSFCENLSEAFQLEVTEHGGPCREIPTAVWEALVKGSRAGRGGGEWMTWEDFLHEAMGDNAISEGQKEAFVTVAPMNYAHVTAKNESLKVLGRYLTAVSVVVLPFEDWWSLSRVY